MTPQPILAVIFGFLADRALSRRPIFLLGLLALAFATTFLYIGDSLTLLALGRTFQGMASAVVQTLGISLIVDKAPPDQLGSALGIIGASIAASVIVGPVIGGFLYRFAGYHSVFALSYALLVLDILLRIMVIEDGQPEYADGHETPAVCVITADADGFERAERGQYVGKQVVPLFVADTFNWNPDQQGLVFLTLCGGFLLGPFTGRLADRFGTRTIATSGFVLSAPTFMSLQLIHHNTHEQQISLCILLSLIGLSIAAGHAATMVEINRSVQAEVEKRPENFGAKGAIAQANSLRSCAFAGGTAVGPLVAGFLRDEYGWGTMSTGLGATSLAAAPLTWLWLGGPLWRNNKGLRGQENG
ncbi:MAG: hypothetical protein Q9223_006003 [Gallowayella weberi]